MFKTIMRLVEMLGMSSGKFKVGEQRLKEKLLLDGNEDQINVM